tara:strand:- start:1942 stop:2364 length:423 start_codon:yes stop_codon:yes gene_type:complete
MNYTILASVSAAFFIMLDILFKYTECSKIPVEVFVSVWYILGGIIAFIFFYIKQYYNERISIKNILIMFFMALLTFTGNIVYFNSAKKSPNPGLSRALFSGSLILGLSLISIIFFKDIIDVYKIIGILFISFGIILIIKK